MTWVSQLTEPSLAETQLVGMTLVSGPMLLPRWSMKVSTWARAGCSPRAIDRKAATASHQAPVPEAEAEAEAQAEAEAEAEAEPRPEAKAE